MNAFEYRDATEAELHETRGGATKIAVARDLFPKSGTGGHRTGLFRMIPEMFRRTPFSGTKAPAGSGCGPTGCSV